MKKRILFPLLLFTIFLSTSSYSQIKAGAGLVWGSEVEEIGFQLRGIYTINEAWRAGVDFIFWFDGVEDVSIWEMNTNAHYIFSTSEKANLYALGGLNFFTLKLDTSNGSNSSTEVGLNIGAGGELFFTDKISGIAELRYVLGDADQLVIGAGVLFAF